MLFEEDRRSTPLGERASIDQSKMFILCTFRDNQARERKSHFLSFSVTYRCVSLISTYISFWRNTACQEDVIGGKIPFVFCHEDFSGFYINVVSMRANGAT